MKKLFNIFLDVLLRILRLKPFIRFIKKYKPLMIVSLVALLLFFLEWVKTFDIKEILEHKKALLYFVQERPLTLSVSFFFIYLFISTLSLPGTTVFNIIGGFLFGLVKGTLLSIFAITIGSSFAFLLTRFFLRDFFIKKGGAKMKKIYELLKKDEVYYLFAFRLFPFTPLFFTNIVMGLSSIKLSVFYVVSFISLLPLLIVYANMGAQLSELEDLQGLAAPDLLFAFGLIGLFPLFVRYLLRFVKRLKKSREDFSLESDNLLLG